MFCKAIGRQLSRLMVSPALCNNIVDDAFHESGIFLLTLHVLITDVRIDTEEEPRRFQSAYLRRSGPGAELLGKLLRTASTVP